MTKDFLQSKIENNKRALDNFMILNNNNDNKKNTKLKLITNFNNENS